MLKYVLIDSLRCLHEPYHGGVACRVLLENTYTHYKQKVYFAKTLRLEFICLFIGMNQTLCTRLTIVVIMI